MMIATMSETGKYSLTQGRVLKKLLMVAIPIMGTQAMQMAYNITDMFWLGRVGSAAVAASGAAGMYMWLSFGFLIIGKMGAEIGISQSLGKGDGEEALDFFRHALYINITLGAAFGLVMILGSRTLAAFFPFTEAVLAEDTSAYLSLVGWGMLPAFVSGVIASAFTATGNSRTPFILNTIGLVCNGILDPVCILALGMGIRGAALATILSQFLVFLLMILGILRFKDRPFETASFLGRPGKERLLQVLKWALPIGLETILFCFLSMLCSRIEARFGANAMAVGRIGSQIESLSWLIGGGFGSALVIFVGQNFGAGRQDRIRQGVRISGAIMTVWGILVAAFLCFAGRFVFAVFLPDPEIARLGRYYCYIFAACQISMNLEAVWSGAFKGTGQTLPPSLVSIISNALKPVLALVLSRTSLGLFGVWVGVSGAAILRGLGLFLWYMISPRSPRRGAC
jgi:putative MATE family efflux protein